MCEMRGLVVPAQLAGLVLVVSLVGLGRHQKSWVLMITTTLPGDGGVSTYFHPSGWTARTWCRCSAVCSGVCRMDRGRACSSAASSTRSCLSLVRPFLPPKNNC